MTISSKLIVIYKYKKERGKFMRKQEKTYLIIIILIAIIALSIFFITRGKGKKEENKVVPNTENKVQAEEYVQVLENGTKLNTSTKSKTDYKKIVCFAFLELHFLISSNLVSYIFDANQISF